MNPRPDSWRRWLNLAGGLLALAAVGVLVTGLFHSTPAPSPTIIAVQGPAAQPAAGPSRAGNDGVVRDGGVVVDNPDPAALGASGPARAVTVEPIARPQPLTNINVTAWLIVWLGLLVICLVFLRLVPRGGSPAMADL